MHLAPGCGREAANRKVVEGWTRMSSAALPSADDIVALGDQIGCAPEIEIGECGAETGHEGFDVITAATRLVQRVFEQHVRRGKLVDNRKIDVLAPELSKPAADDGFVIMFLAHWYGSS